MPNLLKDWSWRPDVVTLDALERGTRKLKEYERSLREDMVRFNLSQVVRRTRKQESEAAYGQEEIRAYLQRIVDIKRGAHVEVAVVGSKHAKTVRVNQRRGGGEPRVAVAYAEMGDASRRRKSKPVRRPRAGRHIKTTDSPSTVGNRRKVMSFAAVIFKDSIHTHAMLRCETMPAARKAVAALLPALRTQLHVITDSSDMSEYTHMELNALMGQFGIEPDEMLARPKKECIVRHYLSQFDKTHHDETSGALVGEQYIQPLEEVEVETQTGNEKAARKAAAKKKGKSAKANGEATERKVRGDGLGREGTPARCIRELIMEGKDNATVLAAALKKFPKNPLNVGYIAWYRNDMRKHGLLDDKPAPRAAAAKKEVVAAAPVKAAKKGAKKKAAKKGKGKAAAE